MKRIFLCLAVVGLSLIGARAQSISGGFKAGLNFSRFIGDQLDDGMNGNSVESYDNSTGFHVGAIINFKLTDYFGFRTELLYSQKGTSYTFDGPSYLRLYNSTTTNSIILDANRRASFNINNSYVDIPVMAYVKLGPLELSGGVNAGLLLGSRGSGEISFSGLQTPLGQDLDNVIIAVDANYFQDEYQISDFIDPGSLQILNTTYVVPTTVGAYYDANDSDENLFNRLDLGLNAQVALFLNKGLFVSLRANYGLSDVTNQKQDVDFRDLEVNGRVKLRDDFDQNFSLQASVGFSF
jgi:hypothetical protein